MKLPLLAIALLSLAPVCASAQQVLKHEPPGGAMRGGEVVLVDDGKCPKGQIKKVTAGFVVGRFGQGNSGGKDRTRECVPRG